MILLNCNSILFLKINPTDAPIVELPTDLVQSTDGSSSLKLNISKISDILLFVLECISIEEFICVMNNLM